MSFDKDSKLIPSDGRKLKKFVTESNWLKFTNLRCPEDGYIMKVPNAMIEVARPLCPCCGGEMLDKEQRKKLKLVDKAA